MDRLEIVVGTYDSLILGYKLVSKLDGSYGLETSFTEDPREGALRCVYISPSGTLVSSSSHTSVRLHNLVKRKSLGELYQHDDQVNCVTFYKQSHMLTASDDGTICMWKTKNWEMMRVLKGHKSHVLAVAVHPSGKLALSVGSDRSLLTWDLVTGKLAFHRKIPEAATNLLFTPDGNHYVLVYTTRIEICSLEDTSTVLEIPTSCRINSVCLMKDDVLAIGGDDRYIRLIDIFSGQELLTLDMARPQDNTFSRVRCICATSCDKRNLLLAATSNGNIKVFEVNLSERTTDVVLMHSAGVRVTCMAVHNSADSTLHRGDLSQPREDTQVKSRKSSAQSIEEEEDREQIDSSHTGVVKAAPTQHQKSCTNDGFTSKHSSRVQSPSDRNKNRKPQPESSLKVNKNRKPQPESSLKVNKKRKPQPESSLKVNKKRKPQPESSLKVNKKRKLPTLETQKNSGKTSRKKMKKASTPSGARELPQEHMNKVKKSKSHR